MIELTDEFKKKVLEALREARERYDGSDSGFAKKYGCLLYTSPSPRDRG